MSTALSYATPLAQVMTQNPVIVDRASTLDEGLQRLACYGFRHLPVVECNRLLGIVSDRDLCFATGFLRAEDRAGGTEGHRGGPERIVDILRTPVHTLNGSASVLEAAQLMLTRHIGAVPIVEPLAGEPSLAGIVTESDLLRVFLEQCGDTEGLDGPVSECPHSTCRCIGPGTSLERAYQELDRDVLHMVVGTPEKMLGILSERDLLLGLARGVLLGPRETPPGRVSDVMSTRVFSVTPETTLSCGVGRMLDHKIGALPVLEGGVVRGMRTRRDVLRRMCAAAKRPENHARCSSSGK
jgi:CBS domain-containing protein